MKNKRISGLLWITVSLLGLHLFSIETEGGPIVELMSFNIRYGTASDGENSWDRRRELLYEVIRRENTDIVCVQEALDFQLREISSALPEYSRSGEGRDGGSAGEYSAILFRRKRFEAVESGTFWLSDTPEKPSITWGNACIRICSWARFRDGNSGGSLYIFNTHLDHVSQVSRENGVRLIARRIRERPHPDPVVLCGDFNIGEDNPALRYLTERSGENPYPLADSFHLIHPIETNVGTFNGFGSESVDNRKIDYILVDGNATVLDARIIRTMRNGRYPSDHFPVTARLHFSRPTDS